MTTEVTRELHRLAKTDADLRVRLGWPTKLDAAVADLQVALETGPQAYGLPITV